MKLAHEPNSQNPGVWTAESSPARRTFQYTGESSAPGSPGGTGLCMPGHGPRSAFQRESAEAAQGETVPGSEVSLSLGG